MNLAITPNLTAIIPTNTSPPSSGNATATTTTAVAPAPQSTVLDSLPGMYYWRGALKLSNDAPATNGGGGASNNAAPSVGVVTGVVGVMGAWATFANMMIALIVLAFVNIVAL